MKTVASNFIIEGKQVLIKPNYPFQVVLARQEMLNGRPQRAEARTLMAILSQLKAYFKDHKPGSVEVRSAAYQAELRKAA